MEISKEITKEQIAGLLKVLNRCSNLAERLKRNLQKKPKLDVLEKSWLAEHISLIADINNSNLLLAGLNDVSVIQLEPERAESMPPPSAPASVAEAESEPDSVLCDICLTETKNSIKINTETLCVACNNWREDKENKRKAKEEEAEKLLQDARAIQEKKDKRSTEASKMRKDEIDDLQKQIDIYTKIELLRPLTDKESMVYNKFKLRISELRANRKKR